MARECIAISCHTSVKAPWRFVIPRSGSYIISDDLEKKLYASYETKTP